ncbi:MAG: hypothetical protein FJW40_08735 [Acidobacteria bacterium]|nr:hypothetical protein [Acidobacteriota bacterium]
MDLRSYYQKMRDVRAKIADAHVVIVSLGTSDGGVAGELREVKRETAAQLIVDQRARLATAEEAGAYRAGIAEEHRKHVEESRLNQFHYTIVSDTQLQSLVASQSAAQQKKGGKP